jgi:hypothetical protein
LAVNLAACLLLLVQFLLGMTVNLYVNLPSHHPGARAHDFFAGVASGIAWVIPDGPAWVAAHAAFGLALVVAALANVGLSWQMATRAYTAASTIGFLAILGAAFNGASFLNYEHAYSSMIMSGLWALALGSYLACLFLAARLNVGEGGGP